MSAQLSRFACVLMRAAVMVSFTPVARSADVPVRTEITYATLMRGQYRSEIKLSAFAPPPGAQAPAQQFEGTLHVAGKPSTRTVYLESGYLAPKQIAAARTFPADFDYDFVQDGDVLLPVRRGYIVTNHPHWDFVLEPGRVWSEPGDKGYTRAALPFELVQKHMNCTHYGVMMFLFRADGSISHAAMQVSSTSAGQLKCPVPRA